MKTSIATVSISGDLREKLSAIASAGFDGVEIFENDFLAFDGTPSEVGAMIRDHGLEITLFQPFRDFEGLPEPESGRAFDRAERKFDLMQELGSDLMLVCSSVLPAALGGIDRAAADFCELGERAQKRGLRVGYEALAWGRHINDYRDAWEIVRRADHQAIGLILDSFHTLARGIDVSSIRSIPGDRIFNVQLADAPRMDMDLLQWSRHYRNMPGEGDLDVTGFIRAVAATGYDGPAASTARENLLFQKKMPCIKACKVEEGYLLMVAVLAARVFPVTDNDNPLLQIDVIPLDLADLFLAHCCGDREADDPTHRNDRLGLIVEVIKQRIDLVFGRAPISLD